MKTLLITGLDGFTGQYLAEQARLSGFRIVGTVHHQPDVLQIHAELHICDLTDSAAVSALIQLVQPDAVAHLAAISFVAHGDAEAIYRTNILGSRHLLEALALSKKRPEVVLLASSANIYGNSTEGRLDEGVAPSPANDYAVSKLAMEYMARLYADKLPITLVRPFNYTGVGQSPNFLLPKIVDHIRRRAPIIELGNLDVARDFSDVRMVSAYYLKLLQTPQPSGSVFNVCSGKAHTLNYILNLARSISGHEFQVQVNPAFVRANEVKILVGNKEKLDAAVGMIPAISIEETLRWMIEAP
jgi:nucleoside-diphosphate-sugar epimerase